MKTSRVLAVVGLSAVLGSGWLLIAAYPSEIAPPYAGCIHFAVIGLVGLLAANRDDAKRDGATRDHWRGWTWGRAADVAAAGLAIFVLPGIVSQLVAGSVSSSASVALFCAVPLFIVLGMAWFGDGSGRGFLPPSMLGLFGALLVFSVEVPGSLRRAVGLAVIMGCAAVLAGASVWIFRLLRGLPIAQAVAVIGIAGAAVLGFYGAAVGWPRTTLAAVGLEALRCIVFDLPVVWMTVWLMREVPPIRLTARFLIAPAVTWVEGYAMVHGPVEVRSVVALVAMAAGAAMLLLKDESDEVPGLRLR